MHCQQSRLIQPGGACHIFGYETFNVFIYGNLRILINKYIGSLLFCRVKKQCNGEKEEKP